jgi:SAM-dependent methyltransferase
VGLRSDGRDPGNARSQAAIWDGEAERFDDAPDHGLSDPRVQQAWRALLTAALPPPPARIADLGSGTGTLSVLLAGQGHHVLAFDLSRRMIERAVAKVDAGTSHPHFVVADITAPPLRNGSLDAVLVRHVLWTLPEPRSVLSRWLQLLATRGRLVLIEGRWHTGAGLEMSQLEALIEPLARITATEVLGDPQLWGGPINDERYLMVIENRDAPPLRPGQP